MKRFALLLCCCSFLLTGCNKEEKDGLGSIYGMVIEETTGEPIPGVRITLEKRSREDYPTYYDDKYYWGIIGGTVSFADGHFEFIDLHTHISYLEWRDVGSGSKTSSEKARYRITIENPDGYSINYQSKQQEITLENDRVARVDFLLRKRNPDLNVQTLPVSTIIGNRVVFMGKCESSSNYCHTEEVGFIYTNNAQSIEEGVRVTASLPEEENGMFNFETYVRGIESGTYKVYAYAKSSLGEEVGKPQTFKIEQSPQGVIVWRQLGLMIQETDIPIGFCTWTEANSACQSSRVGGYSDWRLPTMGELLAICAYKDIIGGFSFDFYYSSNFRKTADGHDWYWLVAMDAYCNSDYIAWQGQKARAVRTITE